MRHPFRLHHPPDSQQHKPQHPAIYTMAWAFADN